MDAAVTGTIIVDDGAKNAILSNKSLLPSGIISVKGNFNEKRLLKASRLFFFPGWHMAYLPLIFVFRIY